MMSDADKPDSVEYGLILPFNRYYMEESLARSVDRRIGEALGDSTGGDYAAVMVYEGQAVLKDVYVNGKTIREFARESAESDD